MVPTHTENDSILARSESVKKTGELKCDQKERRHPGSNFSDFQSFTKTCKGCERSQER